MLGNILTDTLVTGLPLIPVFLGIYLVLNIREDFDLTVEGSFALGGAVTAVLLTGGFNPWLALLLGTASGSLAGLVTSLLNLVLQIPVLMAGLVMTMALFTVTLRVLGMPTVSLVGAETIFTAFSSGRPSDLTMSLILAGIVVLVLGGFALFLRTEIGLALRASGANARMVRSQGTSDRQMLVLSLMISNGLSALGGALMVQMQGYADVNMGGGIFIAGAGAVLLGMLLVNPGGSQVVRIVVAVLIGGLLYRLVLVSALRIGLPAGDLKGVTALTLVIAVAAQAYLAPALARYRIRLRPRTPLTDSTPDRELEKTDA